MTSPFEQAGTIAVTRGSRTVTGTGSSWLAGYDGLVLNIAGAIYPISSVDGPTSLTLVEPYPGANATGLSYFLLPIMNENYALSRQVLALIAATKDLAGSTVLNGPAGEKGDQGVGVSNTYVDQATGHLMVRLTDGKSIDAGLVVGPPGQAVDLILQCFADDATVANGVKVAALRAPRALKLTGVRASLYGASQGAGDAGGVRLDVKLGGKTILNAPLLIPTGTTTSVSATISQPYPTVTDIPDDGELTVDVLAPGINALGLRVTFTGNYA
ncbi:hypothetical protein AV944_00380 [Sphingomonas sp. LK11]|uniref:hypothetical protein n=1 Tax=Sphingomonas sp. LK11 TaxID=1390395 RepID=UPI000972AC6F|nr:hypothetical protein [Sphingomonas sp. LK11]APX64556.1 hypothetical protein AV944_00380 [Sphingomonas sp. LK11]